MTLQIPHQPQEPYGNGQAAHGLSTSFRPGDEFWETCIHKLIGEKKSFSCRHQLFDVLKTWEPQSPGSGKFLAGLTRCLSPERWKELDVEVQAMVLKELSRIDNGRNIIAPWAASVITINKRFLHFPEAREYLRENKAVRNQLAKDWLVWLGDDSWLYRNFAWQLLLSHRKTDLSGKDFTEPAQSDNPAENLEDERWLTELVCQHLPLESNRHVLATLSEWQPDPRLPSELRLRVLQHWVEKIRCRKPDQGTTGSADDFEQKIYNRIFWQGVLTVGTVCPEGESLVNSLIESRLSLENDPEILLQISKWQPPGGKRPPFWQVLWSRLLLVDHEKVYGCTSEVLASIWQSLKKEKTHGEEHDPLIHPEVWDNCLTWLKSILQSASGLGWHKLFYTGLPAGLSREQRTAWQQLWINMLDADNQVWHRAALAYLLEFGDPSLPGGEALEKRVPEMISNVSWVSWHGSEVLIQKLCHSIQDENRRFVLSFLLSILRQETDVNRLALMSVLHPGNKTLPEPLRQEILSIWKERATESNPAIRKTAWTVLIPAGNEIGDFLYHCLAGEDSPSVLSVMASWLPSDRSSFTHEFWERLWQRWAETITRFSSGSREDINNYPFFSSRDIIDSVWQRDLLLLAFCHTDGLEFYRQLLNHLEKRGKDWQEVVKSCRQMVAFLLDADYPERIFEDQFHDQPAFCHVYRLQKRFISLFDDRMDTLWQIATPCTRDNLFLLATGVLRSSLSLADQPRYFSHEEKYIEKSLELIRQWCHHEASRSDISPELFQMAWCNIRGTLMNAVSTAGTKNYFLRLLESCHHLFLLPQKAAFCQALEEIVQVPRHPLSRLADLFLWREVCVAQEMTRECPGRGNIPEKEVDPIPGRRWLREWIHRYLPGESRSGLPEADPKLGKSFGCLLWETMEPGLCRITQRKMKYPDGFCPDGFHFRQCLIDVNLQKTAPSQKQSGLKLPGLVD